MVRYKILPTFVVYMPLSNVVSVVRNEIQLSQEKTRRSRLGQLRNTADDKYIVKRCSVPFYAYDITANSTWCSQTDGKIHRAMFHRAKVSYYRSS